MLILVPPDIQIPRREIKKYLTPLFFRTYDWWIEYRDFAEAHLPEPGGLNQQSRAWRKAVRLYQQEYRRHQEIERKRRQSGGN